jgi:alkyldihydroxyacetonephosphate synthase
MREHVGVTGPLPSATARGKALQREIAALGVAASCEGADLWAASRDCSPAALLWAQARMISHPPDVVAWPEEAEQVAALIRLAAGRGVPVVPMGAGTGTGGGAVALRGGIVLDTKRLTHPLRVDLPGNVVEVGAGMSAERLEERLAYAGATLGHLLPPQDPGTVGGWLATRGAGMLSARHGSSADLVLSLEAVDGAGEILHTLEGAGGGPDLAQLLLGSEGTLAVFTSARLRIWPRSGGRWLRAVRFPSLRDALRGLRDVVRAGLQPSVVRVHDPLDTLLGGAEPPRVPQPLKWLVEGAQVEAMRLALRAPLLLNRLVDALPSASMALLGFEGVEEADAFREGNAALAICARAQGEDLGAATAARCLEAARRASWTQGPLLAAGGFVETLDVATTWDRAEPLLAAVRSAVEGLVFVRTHFAHAAAEGCALELKMLGLAGAPVEAMAKASLEDAESEMEEAQHRREMIWGAALAAAADEGATISHHSGIGVSRQVFLRRELGEGVRQLRALKKAFDPKGILNPGKVLL